MSDRAAGMRINVSENGPYMVWGGVPLVRVEIVANEAGESVDYREIERYEESGCYALCRCGRSGTKPHCDGTHDAIGFDGTETASRESYTERSACIDGPEVKLRDARELCAEARFCDREGGLWNRVKTASTPEERAAVEAQAAQCPSGRYTICDTGTDEPYEEDLEPSIVVLEDPQLGVSGPLYVRGGIQVIASDGHQYEVRNRLTLCRCGESSNKPFCDGSHIGAGFNDGTVEPLEPAE